MVLETCSFRKGGAAEGQFPICFCVDVCEKNKQCFTCQGLIDEKINEQTKCQINYIFLCNVN